MKKFLTGIGLLLLICAYSQEYPDYYKFNNYIVENPDSLPLGFDGREQVWITEVITQNPGGCWASAALTCVSSRYKHLSGTEVTLSDLHLLNCHGFDNSRTNMGNHYMVSAYLSGNRGPYLKGGSADSLCIPEAKNAFYVPEVRYLPGNPALIKSIILHEGPVFSMIYYKKRFLDTLTNIYCTDINKLNHMVNLVGWNDTIKTSSGSGVWIAQNSLGKEVGDDGFIYVDYRDVSILKKNAFWPQIWDHDPRMNVYYYDTLGFFYNYGFEDTVCFGLTKFVAENNLQLVAVNIGVNYPGTRVHFKVFETFNDTSGSLQHAIYKSDPVICDFNGYYNLSIGKDIFFEKNHSFYIMVAFSHPTEINPMPVECYVENYTDPHLMDKHCWINPDFERWPQAWTLCGKDSEWPSLHFDLCIKAVTISTEK